MKSFKSRSQSHDSFPLNRFPSQSQNSSDSEEAVETDLDASFSSRPWDRDEERKANTATLETPGILRRIFPSMSHKPLLFSPDQASSSYGVIPDMDVLDTAVDVKDDKNYPSRSNEKKGKSSALGTSSPAGRPSSRRNILQKSSISQEQVKGQDSERTLLDHSGGLRRREYSSGDSSSNEDNGAEELVIDEDENTGSWSEGSPSDNSLYPQVRASVSATDDASLSISTPRMWVLSLLCALIGSAANLFFSLRYPSVGITPVIALVIVHPLGRAWDRFLKRPDDPVDVFNHGALRHSAASERDATWRRRLRLWLAQGTWNEKEHCCVYISSNVSFGFAFATDVIVEQTKFYNQTLTIAYQILLTVSSQILGYAFAGLTRRYLVRPPSMIWPGTLMATAMFTTMHKSQNKVANGWRISRWKFFLLVWSGSFAWYFLPGLLMPALSYFSVITWFAPNNVVIANLFGVSSGLGLFPMTFNWAQIAYIGSPLVTPWWAAANVVGGLVIVMWIIAPIMYYSNIFYSAYMPILSSDIFDNTGKPYNISKILTPDFLFDREAYQRYSKTYLPVTYFLSYGLQFAGLTALVTHTVCWHGKEIWEQTVKSLGENRDHRKVRLSRENRPEIHATQNNRGSNSSSLAEPKSEGMMSGEDVHNRLMSQYEDAPMMWYLGTLVAMLAIGIFLCEYYPVHLPWYGLLLALAITGLLFIPVGIVMAITNQQSSLYIICQLVCGVVFPGRPVANMVFVTYGYISSTQGLKFSSDLKLGHYMKIPPRLLFKVQMLATLVASFTQIGVLNWMFSNIQGICTPEAINGFICPLARVHFNGSILWGVIGPTRFFGPGALYQHLVWAFLIGAIGPIIIWSVGRHRATSSIWRKINLPVVFGSLGYIPPATGLNFSVWAVICFTFNNLLRRRAPAWWSKYTMTLSAALDSGLAFGVVIIFFGFVYPGWVMGLKWWGTEVYKQGCDWHACPYIPLAPGEHFGP